MRSPVQGHLGLLGCVKTLGFVLVGDEMPLERIEQRRNMP